MHNSLLLHICITAKCFTYLIASGYPSLLMMAFMKEVKNPMTMSHKATNQSNAPASVFS